MSEPTQPTGDDEIRAALADVLDVYWKADNVGELVDDVLPVVRRAQAAALRGAAANWPMWAVAPDHYLRDLADELDPQ